MSIASAATVSGKSSGGRRIIYISQFCCPLLRKQRAKNQAVSQLCSCWIRIYEDPTLRLKQSYASTIHASFRYFCTVLKHGRCPRLHHGLCGSNKLLYKRYAFSLREAKFRPPQLPHFLPIFLKLKTKKHIRDMNPHAKFGRDQFTVSSGRTPKFWPYIQPRMYLYRRYAPDNCTNEGFSLLGRNKLMIALRISV